jgi:hypothetical protein
MKPLGLDHQHIGIGQHGSEVGGETLALLEVGLRVIDDRFDIQGTGSHDEFLSR